MTRHHQVLLWLLVGVVAAVTLLLVEDVGGRELDHLLLFLPGVDKLLHIVQSCLITLVVRAVMRRRGVSDRTATISAATVASVLAVVDEIQQMWVPHRSVETGDLLASASGVALGFAAAQRRRAGAAVPSLASIALVAGLAVTYRSYEETKDYNHGLRLESAGRFREARDAYRRALANGTASADLYNALAWVEIESGVGDPRAAVAWAERAASLRPDDADVLDTYGWALYHVGRFDEAAARLADAYARKPSIYCIHYHLGVVALARGDAGAATHHLRAQIAQAPAAREATRARTLLSTDHVLRAHADSLGR